MPGTTLKAGSIFTSAKSLPMPAFQLLATVPIAASVTTVFVGSTRVAIWAITVLPPCTQWPAVPMYDDRPSVKTKFIVQPFGETMQVPADTALTETPSVPAYGGAVPRQFTSSASSGASGTSTPFGPAATICASSVRRQPGRPRLVQGRERSISRL